MTDHDRFADVIASYAIGAVEVDEIDAIQAHLAECAICPGELERHLETIAALEEDEPMPELDLSPPSPIAQPQPLPLRPRTLPAWAKIAAAVAAIGLVAALGFIVQQQGRIDDLETVADFDRAVSDAREQAASLAGIFTLDGVAGAEVVLTAAGEGFFAPSALPELDPERTYQLWVLSGDRVISAGVFGPDPGPSRFTWTGQPVDGFALTREVAGGVEASAGDVAGVIQF